MQLVYQGQSIRGSMTFMEAVKYTVQIHPAAEGGYWAEVPALPGCFTQADTLEELSQNVREAMECYLMGLMRDNQPFPVEKRTRKSYAIPVSVRLPRPA